MYSDRKYQVANTAPLIPSITTFAPVTDLDRNTRSGISGWRAYRASRMKKPSSRAAAAARVSRVGPEPQGCWSVLTMP